MIKSYKNINKSTWPTLCQRPVFNQLDLNKTVGSILQKVKKEGDQALFYYNEKFDGAQINLLQVSDQEINEAQHLVDNPLKQAIQIAAQNIKRFHAVQITEEPIIETTKGVKCWRKSIGINKVGLYIPGGTAPLFSTILMLGIPAKLAGCQEIILCTPPVKNGSINPIILYTAQLVGIQKIYKIGGAQAIAAMAYGTESVPQVYKIFGPGNQYVTKAKEMIQTQGIAIDMPAGPSEVLIIADESSHPSFVAADLLSQAEHGADSQVILLSNNESMLEKIIAELEKQLNHLNRKAIATKAIANSRSILLKSIEECIQFSNTYAPEHLIIATDNASAYIGKITTAGSVFLGHYSCESAGDYASGTNHTLPTNGYARSYSGVSVDSFVKKITFQRLTKEGIENIGPAIELMAEAEGLDAHKNAVSVRINKDQ